MSRFTQEMSHDAVLTTTDALLATTPRSPRHLTRGLHHLTLLRLSSEVILRPPGP